MNKKKLLLRILVGVLIAGSLTVIWVLKTHPTPDPLSKVSPGVLVKAENEEDFALETTAIDLDTLKAYGLPIIIDFGADSCIPCKEMAPVLKTMNAEMQGKAIIKFVDVWKYSDVAADFPIQVIPTQVLINSDGTPYVPSDTIGIDFTMYSSEDTNEHVFTVHQGGLTEEQMRAILEDMGVASDGTT
ncbi:MAG: thioredoxin domain-containing protein [Oscillospiraceae bacterium]